MSIASVMSAPLSGAGASQASRGLSHGDSGANDAAEERSFDAVLANSLAVGASCHAGADSESTSAPAADLLLSPAATSAATSTGTIADEHSDDPLAAIQDLLMLLPAQVQAMPPATPMLKDGLKQASAAESHDGELSDQLSATALDTLSTRLAAGAQSRGLQRDHLSFSMQALETKSSSELAPISAQQAERTASGQDALTLAPPLPAADPGLMKELTSTTSMPATRATLTSPVGSHGWRQEFGRQITWLAKSDLQAASLSLNPPELGPVRVELQISGTDAIARFISHVPEVRMAIESAIPELKASLEASGLNLSEATVGQGMPDRQEPGSQQGSAAHAQTSARSEQAASGALLTHDDTLAQSGSARTTGSRHLLDLYA